MRRKYMWWLIAALVVALLGAAVWGPIVSNVEQPKYQVVESSGNIEIRDYAPMIVAEAEVAGERRDAIGKGFRISRCPKCDPADQRARWFGKGSPRRR